MSELKRGDWVTPKHDKPPLLYAGREYKVLETDSFKDITAKITTEIFGSVVEINKRNFNRFKKV